MQFLILLVSFFSFAATPAATAPAIDGDKLEKVTIKTSAVGEMCKVTIEKALYALEGVEKAELDLVTKKVKVKYDADMVDVATMRQAISAAGYDADDIPARPKAKAALPKCCKKGKSCSSEKKAGI